MFRIEFTPEAIEDMRLFRKTDRKRIIDEIEKQLKHQPMEETRNRKRLRPNELAEWELRIDKFLSTRKDEKEIPQLKKLKSKIPITTIIQCACNEFRCSEDQAKIKGRKNNKVRAIAMYLARDLSGVSGKDLGVFFDGISGAAITMKYNQINAELMRNKKLRDTITNLKKQLLNI